MNERERLVGFIREVADFILRSDSSAEGMRAQFARLEQAPSSLAGLRAAASDMVEWCRDLTPEQVGRLDSRLGASTLPTLSRMRSREYRRLLTVLARARIQTESEYRLLEGFVSDSVAPTLSDAERSQASELLANYHGQWGSDA
jgi:hypothetical protein